MRHIKKESEPQEYTNWKKKNKPQNYSNLTPEIKQYIKFDLLKEQYHLCCYCEKNIDNENSTIEHLKPIDKAPKEQLEYANYLASCDSKNHCNHKRGNKPLSVNPLQENIEKEFQFYLTYRNPKTPIIKIKGNEQVIETLNLNDSTLQRQRGKTLFGLIAGYGSFDLTTLNISDARQIAEKISIPDENGNLQEFVSAITNVLSELYSNYKKL